MIDASAACNPSMPCTRSRSSTTALGSEPILQVPTGWCRFRRFLNPIQDFIVSLYLVARPHFVAAKVPHRLTHDNLTGDSHCGDEDTPVDLRRQKVKSEY